MIQAFAKAFSTPAIALLLSACVAWRPYELGQEAGPGSPFPHLLRVTRQDSSRIVLTAPYVRADTLFGLKRVRGDTLAVPKALIARLEHERLNLGRTLAVAIGVPALAFGVTYLLVCVEHDCNPGF